jgi:hypothetical protein
MDINVRFAVPAKIILRTLAQATINNVRDQRICRPAALGATCTMKRHWDCILNWFKSGINNGILEGINRLVQSAKSRVEAYRTYPHARVGHNIGQPQKIFHITCQENGSETTLTVSRTGAIHKL